MNPHALLLSTISLVAIRVVCADRKSSFTRLTRRPGNPRSRVATRKHHSERPTGRYPSGFT